MDVELEERAGDGLLGGFDCAVLTARTADAHQRGARVLHDRADVREVLVDEARHRDDVADALDALAQHVVHDAERIEDARVLLDDVLEPVVRDRDQRVDLGLELLGRLLRDELALVALEGERLGHDADGEGARLLGDLGHDRGGTRPGPAAEARRDEDHVRVGEGRRDLLRVLLRRALADRCVAAGAEAAGDLVADADLVRGVRLQERLGVRVAGDELHAHHLGPDHPVDGVGTAAADADDADQREVLGIGTQRHRALLRGPVGGHGVAVGVGVRWRGGTRRTVVRPGRLGFTGV